MRAERLNIVIFHNELMPCIFAQVRAERLNIVTEHNKLLQSES